MSLAPKLNATDTQPEADEKMDTASDSFVSSEATPNSVLSSDFEDHNDQLNGEVLRLQNPDTPLRLSDPKNDSLVTKMSKLALQTPETKTSALTTTTQHPLMGLNSPTDFENDFSKQRNTSKNNLYIDSVDDMTERRRIKAHFQETDLLTSTPLRVFENGKNYLDVDSKQNLSVLSREWSDLSGQTTVPEWFDASSLADKSVFDLPMELSSHMKCKDIPPLRSPSPIDDKSNYEATVDLINGSARLTHTPSGQGPVATQRRKIYLPPDDNSLDSLSIGSLESDEVNPNLDLNPILNTEHGTRVQEESVEGKQDCTSLSDYSDVIQEYSAAEEFDNERSWLKVPLATGGHSTCDMKVIEPFKRVISHGGYASCGAAIIVFSACYLPHKDRPDYSYVMNNLFLYVMWTLERLVTEEYMLVYLHGSASKDRLPNWHFLHEWYKLVDRRLRKNLRHLYLVHPTFWIKSILMLAKTFVSSKFFKKITYVKNLKDLQNRIDVEPNAIPNQVKEYDSKKY